VPEVIVVGRLRIVQCGIEAPLPLGIQGIDEDSSIVSIAVIPTPRSHCHLVSRDGNGESKFLTTTVTVLLLEGSDGKPGFLGTGGRTTCNYQEKGNQAGHHTLLDRSVEEKSRSDIIHHDGGER
jgi:hypothetical protein